MADKLLEEYKKRKAKESVLNADSTQETKSTSSGLSAAGNALLQEHQKRQGESASVLGYNNFFDKYSSFTNRLNKQATERSKTWQSADAMATAKGQANENALSLMREATAAKKMLTQYKDKYDSAYGAGSADKMLQSLTDAQNSLFEVNSNFAKEANYYSNFKDADEYDAYNRWKDYQSLPQNKDYAENSAYVSTQKENNAPLISRLVNPSMDTQYTFGDPYYDYINGNKLAANYVKNMESQSSADDTTGLSGLLNRATNGSQEMSFMTDDEVSTFNYIYKTRGKESAYQYVNDLEAELNARERQDTTATWSELATQHPFITSALSVPEKSLEGISYINQLGHSVLGDLDQNAGYNRFAHVNTAIRGTVADNISDSVKQKYGETWGNLASDGYQLGMSMADSLYNAFLTSAFGADAYNKALKELEEKSGNIPKSKLSEMLSETFRISPENAALAIMGTSAAAESVIEAKDNGSSDARAMTLGTIAGAAEYLTERIGLENLFDKEKLAESTAKYIFSQTGFEASEEGASDIINWIADSIYGAVTGDQTDFQRMVSEYEADGKSESEAVGLAVKDRLKEFGKDVLGGAISGFGLGAGSAALNTVGANVYRKAIPTYSISRDQNASRELISEGMSSNPNSNAYKVAQANQQKMDSGKSLNFFDVRKQQNANQNEINQTEKFLNSLGNTITNRQAEMIAQDQSALSALGVDTTGLNDKQTREAVKKAFANRIEEQNASKSNVSSTAENTRSNGQIFNGAADVLSRATTGKEVSSTEIDNAVADIESVLKQSNLSNSDRTTYQNMRSQLISVKNGTLSATESYARNSFGENGQRTYKMAIENYSGVMDPIQITHDYTQAYNAGFNGRSVSYNTDLEKIAYKSGQLDAAMKGGISYENNSRRERQTSDLPGYRKVSEIIEGKRGQEKRSESQRKTATNRKHKAENEPLTSAKEIGIPTGSTEKNIHVFKESDYDSEMRHIANIAKGLGYKIIFVDRNMDFGNGRSARGFETESGAICVNVCHPSLTATQLGMHEMFHAIADNNPEFYGSLIKKIKEQYDTSIDELIGAYVDAYCWKDENGKWICDEQTVINEIFADAYAGIDIFEEYLTYEGATRFTEEVRNELNGKEFKGYDSNAPPTNVKFSQNPAERNRALRSGEMINRFHKALSKGQWVQYYNIMNRDYLPYTDLYEDNDIIYTNIDGIFLRQVMRTNGEFQIDDVWKITLAESDDYIHIDIASLERIDKLYGKETARTWLGTAAGINNTSRVFEAYNNNGTWGRISIPGSSQNGIPNAGLSESESEMHRKDVLEIRSGNSKGELETKTKFSMETPVEVTKDLIAVHNMTEQNLKDSLKLGGLPMPSIAVTKASLGHTKFGEISLVFSRNTVDPQANRLNHIYGGDAYTPTAPHIDYEPNDNVARKLTDLYYSLPEEYKDKAHSLYNIGSDLSRYLSNHDGETGLIEFLKSDPQMMQAYRAANGMTPIADVMDRTEKRMTDVQVEKAKYFADKIGEDVIREFHPLKNKDWKAEHEADVRKAYRDYFAEIDDLSWEDEQLDELENDEWKNIVSFAISPTYLYLKRGPVTVNETYNFEKTNQAIKDSINQKDYEKWVSNLLNGAEKNKGMANGKDPFDSSGRRRSFSQTHIPVTLDNIVKIMASGNQTGIAGFGSSITGASATEFKNIDEVRGDENRLRMMDDEEFNNIQREYHREFSDIAYGFVKNQDGAMDAEDMMAEAVSKYGTNKRSLKSYISRNGKGWTNDYMVDEVVDDLVDLVNKIRNIPTGYFEAKPRRAVTFNEVLAAVIPDDTDSSLVNDLKSAGVQNVITFEKNNDADRIEKVNSIPNVKFSEETDSSGRKLSESQAEFFKDSQLRDEDGRLQVLYHGTSHYGEITKFKRGKSGILGSGIYLTSDKSYAKRYAESMGEGTIYELYADVKNPLLLTSDNPAKEILGDKLFAKREAKNDNPSFWITQSDIKKLQSQGYDGIVWKYGKTSPEIVVWDSAQIKRVDNQNPTSNPDIRFSEEADHRYLDLAKDPEKNSEALQNMVDDVAESLGYNIEAYRGGTQNVYLKKRDGNYVYGAFFSSAEYIANAFGTNGRGQKDVGRYYLKMDNPLTLDAEGENYNSIPVRENHPDKALYEYAQSTYDQTVSADDIGQWADEHGYDGVIINNVREGVGGDPETDYIVLKSENIKSADPVTYDDNGNVIPLSERFNQQDPDIRYSEEQIKRDKNGKPYSAKAQRDEGYMLSEAKFKQLYLKHKIDIGKRWGDVNSQIESIKSEGFKGGSGTINITPISDVSRFVGVSTYEYYLEKENEGVYEKGYADAYKKSLGDEYGQPIWDNIVQREFAPRKGDYYLLVPEHFVKNNKVVQGFKPFDYEVIKITEDYQKLYPLYVKAYEESKTKFSEETTKVSFSEETLNKIKGDSFNLVGNRATYTDKRIDAMIEDSDYGTGKTDSYIAYINPKDFIKLTTLKPSAWLNAKPGEELSGATYSELDLEKLESNTQTPYLNISIDGRGAKVIGHEGRHRMLALAAAGIDRVPVRLVDRANRYQPGKTTINEITLRGQDFANKYGKGRVTLSNVVPVLSENRDLIRETFGGNGTISFSEELPESTLAKENKELQKQLETRTKQKEYWKDQTTIRNGFKYTQKDINDFSKSIISKYDSTISANDINPDLKDFAEWFMTSASKGNMSFEEAKERSYSIASRIVQNAESLVSEDMTKYKEIRNAVKDGVSISKQESSNIADFDSFRKANFGLITIKSTGLPVDTVYQQLQQLDPDLFPDESNSAEKLENIVGALRSLQPVYENPYNYNMAEATEFVSNDIISSVLNNTWKEAPATKAEKIQQTERAKAEKRIADLDKMYKQAEKEHEAELMHDIAAERKKLMAVVEKANQRAEKAESKLTKAQQTAQDRLARQDAENKSRIEAILQREKARREKAVSDLKHHYQEVKMGQDFRKAEHNLQNELKKIAQRLQRMKTTAANRALINEIIGNLDTVSISMTDKSVKNLRELRDWMESVKAEKGEDYVFDPKLIEKVKRLEKTSIAEYSYEELIELTQILQGIENTIRTNKKLIDMDDRRDVYFQAVDTINDIKSQKKQNLKNILVNGTDFYLTEVLSPMRLTKRIIGYNENDPLYKVMDSMQKGQVNMLDYQRRANALFKTWLDDKKFTDSITGKKAETISISGYKGNDLVEVKINRDMLMSLYLHSMNYDNIKHIENGGLTTPDLDLLNSGKMAEAYADENRIKLTQDSLRQIRNLLTPDEKAFADKAHDYFNGMSRDAVNEVSEKLDGYSLAGVENYFPINTDKNFTKADFESIKNDGSIEGMGFLKERVSADNPIYLEGLTSVLNRSIRMHSKYYGLAIPVRNFNKLWTSSMTLNDEYGKNRYASSIPEAIDSTFGIRSKEYIENLLSELQNPSSKQNAFDKLFSKLRSNYAGAVLTLNASVALKQAASYPTAAAVIGHKALIKAFTNAAHISVTDELISKYTPLFWYRKLGFSSTELGDLSSRGIQLPPALNWVQGMDLATTKLLWRATEYYVRDNFKSLEIGTDEYYEKVAEVYNEVIEATQPNYTTMERPQVLREKSVMAQSVAMFKTQPLQNFNILYDAIGEFNAKRTALTNTEESKTAFKQAKRKLENAVTSQIIQLAVFASMTRLWALLRGNDDKYRDKDGNLNIYNELMMLGKNMASGLFGMFLFGSNVWDIINSKLFGEKYYGFSVGTLEILDDFATQFGYAYKYYTKVFDDVSNGNKIDVESFTANSIKYAGKLSQVFGIPISNVSNLFDIINSQVVERVTGKRAEDYIFK